MEKLPEPDVKVQQIEAVRLPASSYRMRNHRFARVQPFEVWDDNDHQGNNQLNWTNLFLLNKLGHKTLSSVDINVISQISNLSASDESSLREIKLLSANMSSEFAAVKDQIMRIRSQSDLDQIKQSISEVLNQSDVGTKISLLEAKMERLQKLVLLLAAK